MAKEIMKTFTSPGLQSLMGKVGFLALGLMLFVFEVNIGRAQASFSSPQVLSGDWGFVTNDNTGVVPDPGAPSIAGLPPHAPLWYAWTATQDGEVELDTVGSTIVTNYVTFAFDPNAFPPTFTSVTNVNTVNLDTVLGVYTGTDVTKLTQVAANDDLFPINAVNGQINESASPDYFGLPFSFPISGQKFINGVAFAPFFEYTQPYYGPSHLRFNAKGGATYYFATDTKAASTGPVVLNWAYKSAGVFRFASEDFDPTTQLPLYQTSQTESQPPLGLTVEQNSPVLTYYTYNAPGVLVTVTRAAG